MKKTLASMDLGRNVGEPMVSCSGGQMSVTHYADELWREAPACERQEALSAAKSVLTEATNTTTLTTEWAPTQAARDVSGPTPFKSRTSGSGARFEGLGTMHGRQPRAKSL